jgi:hypothetical protein
MATLATFCSRLMGRDSDLMSSRGSDPSMDAYRLRPFPNEDVYFFVKRVDNTKIVREQDPKAGGLAWRSFGLATTAVILSIGALLPHAYGMLAGYQIQQLKQEQERLLADSRALDLKLAYQLSPQRLEELAASQDFETPKAENVIFLEPLSEGSLAMNTKR